LYLRIQNEEKRESRYLTVGKGIWLDLVPDGKVAISFFKTAAFNGSASPKVPETL
jgi:hypothetical protein